ncbi:MAG: hypothetical protein P4M00_09520 [Azospirillaceae bacterium]|nr:hypothetical protein [Azospirillaceae bacterium]
MTPIDEDWTPSLNKLLSDPIVSLIMESDRIDRDDMAMMLHRVRNHLLDNAQRPTRMAQPPRSVTVNHPVADLCCP